MNLKDFFFSYKVIIIRDIEKKNYFKSIKKLFNYPYKYILNKLRNFFLINRINLDKKFKFEEIKKLSIDELFVKFNTDKGSKFKRNKDIFDGHNYSVPYDKYFSKYKNIEKLNILEIGSLRGEGTASFFFYFNKPKIICLDVNPFQIKYFSKNIRKLFIDSQSKKILNYTSKYLNQEFDIIIDDGSHNIRDQIITLNEFFPKLKKDGIYVIEDTCQYLLYNNLNPDKLNYGVNEFLLSIEKNGNHECLYLSNDEKNKIKKNIKKLSFEVGNHILNGINIPEIVFIEKK